MFLFVKTYSHKRGAVAVIGLGALAYVLTKGKLGSKQVQQLAEHIEFKPATTIEEAIAEAKALEEAKEAEKKTLKYKFKHLFKKEDTDIKAKKETVKEPDTEEEPIKE